MASAQTTAARVSVGDIDKGVGVNRSRLERLVAERNAEQHQLAELRAEHARIAARIRELDQSIARKNQAIFLVRPELERLLGLQRQVRERAEREVRLLKEPDTDMSERRRHPRKPLQVDVTMVSESNFYLGFSQDVSEGGLFIATYEGIRPVGERFPLVFQLPEREPVFCLVEVAWVREYREGEDLKHGSPGMGVRFIGLLPEDREAIAAFVEQTREPLFHPEADELSG